MSYDFSQFSSITKINHHANGSDNANHHAYDDAPSKQVDDAVVGILAVTFFPLESRAVSSWPVHWSPTLAPASRGI